MFQSPPTSGPMDVLSKESKAYCNLEIHSRMFRSSMQAHGFPQEWWNCSMCNRKGKFGRWSFISQLQNMQTCVSTKLTSQMGWVKTMMINDVFQSPNENLIFNRIEITLESIEITLKSIEIQFQSHLAVKHLQIPDPIPDPPACRALCPRVVPAAMAAAMPHCRHSSSARSRASTNSV